MMEGEWREYFWHEILSHISPQTHNHSNKPHGEGPSLIIWYPKSDHGVAATQRKNCDPLVSGPLLAMDKTPGYKHKERGGEEGEREVNASHQEGGDLQ